MVRKSILIISIFIGFVSLLKAQQPVDSIAKLPINKNILTSAIITESAVYVAGMSYLQFVWYKDKEPVPFEFYNDSKGYLQIDKCGHAFASYGESYVAYKWLRKAGVSKNKALLFGGSMGFIMQAPIEIFDGMYEGWGFSWSDIIANTAGCALLIGQEMLFNEQVTRLKISYSRSKISREAFGYLGDNALEGFFYDYNSHSFWLTMNANKLFLKDVLPPWLNIAVGYSANGMLGEFKNKTWYNGHKLPYYDRTRQFLLSLDVDWEKIPTHSKFLRTVFSGLNFIKIPFPTIEINSKGKITPYLVYF
jgi:uncharacterized protein YfiM (DUF2279 family)